MVNSSMVLVALRCPGVIHSTEHQQKAWVIRVTGTDLDKLPRYHFRKQDKILEAV